MENYQQIKVLGKGSFGAAWLVKRRKDGAQFVAKEVRLLNMKPAERDAAKHEITMLRQLEHPNITRYVDHFESKGSLFIVMEYANGGDLYTKVQSRRGVRFTEKEVLHYFCQLTLALYHMHGKHILHRDLKSQNVFLTADGVVKLGDFGISTVLRNTYELKRTVCGTPYYFSPELCMNKPYNNKSDIWALGCILYELTTLTHAFDGTSMKALVQRILRGVYPPIHSSYSKELRDLIAAMLALDPQKRPHIAAIVQLPFIRTAMQSLQQDVRSANDEKRSCVTEAERQKEKEEAVRRAEAERVSRAQKAAEDEKERQERLAKVREQMQREMREHEEKLRRQREAQKVDDERRRAERAAARAEEEKARADRAEQEKARLQRYQEERKAREKREAELKEQNRRREEEWERNMKVAREEADARRRDQAAAQEMRAREEEAARAQQADAYRQARLAAKANRERAEEVERRQREADVAIRHAPPDFAAPAPRVAPPVAAAPYNPDEARNAFYEMRRQAEANKMRAKEEEQQRRGVVGPSGAAPQVHQDALAGGGGGATPAGRGVSDARRAPPTPEDEKAAQQQRAEAFWEMRRAAEENKRRLLGGDAPAPSSAKPLEPPGLAQHRQQQQPPTPPQHAAAVPAAAKPPTPPQAPTPAPHDDDLDFDANDEDGAIGLHKFLNAEAAADGDGRKDEDHNASRQADYRGVGDDIQKLLDDPDQGRVLDDFGDDADEATDPAHFSLDGKTLHLPNTSSNDPLGHRIETLRLFLENHLGDDTFFAIYRLISRAEDSDIGSNEAETIAGPSKARFVPLVLQLIVCEEAFAASHNR